MSEESLQSNPQSESQDDAPDFETALKALEALVVKMESGELGLDASLKAFEEGIALTRQCQTALSQAELRVEKLTASEAPE